MKGKKTKKIIIFTLIILIILILLIFSIKKISHDNKTHFEVSNDISIRYAYGLGIQTVEAINKQQPYLDILKFNLKGKDLKQAQKILKNTYFELDKNVKSIGIAGIYEVTNGKEKFYFDEEEAIYTKDNLNFYKIKITTELFDFISDLVYEEVEDKHEVITSKKIYISNDEIGSTTFTNKNTIKGIINSIRYVKLKSLNEELQNTEYFIDFNNGISLTLYQNSNIALYKNTNTNNEYYVLFYNDPKEYLKNYLTDKVNKDIKQQPNQ